MPVEQPVRERKREGGREREGEGERERGGAREVRAGEITSM